MVATQNENRDEGLEIKIALDLRRRPTTYKSRLMFGGW